MNRKSLIARILVTLFALALFTSVDRKSTRLNSSHSQISYAVFCLKKKNKIEDLATVLLTQQLSFVDSIELHKAEDEVIYNRDVRNDITPTQRYFSSHMAYLMTGPT